MTLADELLGEVLDDERSLALWARRYPVVMEDWAEQSR